MGNSADRVDSIRIRDGRPSLEERLSKRLNQQREIGRKRAQPQSKYGNPRQHQQVQLSEGTKLELNTLSIMHQFRDSNSPLSLNDLWSLSRYP